MIQAGEKVIALGEPVNDEKYQILQSLKREYETNPDVQRNLFMIIGNPKSGTTWLQSILNAHPQIVCYGEPKFLQLSQLLVDMLNRYNEK